MYGYNTAEVLIKDRLCDWADLTHTWTNTGEKIVFQLSEALGKLYGQSKGTSSDTVEPSKPRGGAHENCITYTL